MTISYYGELFSAPFKNKMNVALEAAAKKTRDFSVAIVGSRTPVKTGRLKKSWQFTLEGHGIRYLNQTPYAAFVELGTSKMAPRAMLTSSIPEITAFFEKETIKSLSKVTGATLGQPGLPQYTADAFVPGGFTKNSGFRPGKAPPMRKRK